MQQADSSLETRTQEIGRALFKQVHEKNSSLSPGNKWTKELMGWCMNNEELRGRILRFVDVLPALKTDTEVTAYIRAYFPSKESRLPLSLRGGSLLSKAPFTARAVSKLTRRVTSDIAKQFICGETIEEAKKNLDIISAKRFTSTIDVLGEAVLSREEADVYKNTYLNLIDSFPEHSNISIKLSSLSPFFDPLTHNRAIDDVLSRLQPILLKGREKKTLINIDMEQYQYRDLSLSIIKHALKENNLQGMREIGVVFQSYLRDSEIVLEDFLNWLREHNQPMTIRLVKGAYWDYEMAKAKSLEWPLPVWEKKNETDFQFEKLTKKLFDARGLVRAAIGSHNIRSISHALALHEQSNFENDSLEFQLLYGMADPLKSALKDRGYQVRVYSPIGPLIPGMAYLVRRVLENTSNQSFLKLDYAHEANEEELLRAPKEFSPFSESQSGNSNLLDLESFQNEPPLDFSQPYIRTEMQKQLNIVKGLLGRDYPLIINGKKVTTSETTQSINPSNNTEIVGRVSKARWEDVEGAINEAKKGQVDWNKSSPHSRAACLIRAAKMIREQKFYYAAWEVIEVGKSWREADADVTEAIDFLEFYARAYLHISNPDQLKQAPGEFNVLKKEGRGVAAVISPWNFPLAILAGMTSAALVCGNAVLIKPAETASVIGFLFAELMLKAGIPADVLYFLPGPGNEIGRGMVGHPDVDIVAFTGSKEVGLSIIQQAGHTSGQQSNVKKIIAEMGGKNAIIVDDSADQDEALNGILASSFGYQGQKCSACSRLILHHSIHDAFLKRLINAVKTLELGDPINPNVNLGPVIDLHSYKRISSIIEEGKIEARLVYQGPVNNEHKNGYFIPPTIFTDPPDDCVLTRKEIFGPVLTVYRAHSIEEALTLANLSEYALTGGLYSRNLENISLTKENFEVGNLYINKKITGAVVARQPFGGWRMSGLGSKAGGLEYLNHFLYDKTISENTLRHGFPLG